MDSKLTIINCLSACLTVLIRLEILDEKEVAKAIKENGYVGIFDLLNDIYKETVTSK
jgi:hypothetical protein